MFWSKTEWRLLLSFLRCTFLLKLNYLYLGLTATSLKFEIKEEWLPRTIRFVFVWISDFLFVWGFLFVCLVFFFCFGIFREQIISLNVLKVNKFFCLFCFVFLHFTISFSLKEKELMQDIFLFAFVDYVGRRSISMKSLQNWPFAGRVLLRFAYSA